MPPKHYDRGTKELLELSVGQPVRIRLQTGRDKKWIAGTCLGQVAPRSYEVQTKCASFRQNRQMIWSAPDLEKYCVTPSTYSDETTVIFSPLKDAKPEDHNQPTVPTPDGSVTDQGSSGSDNGETKPSLTDTADASGIVSPKRSRSDRVVRLD